MKGEKGEMDTVKRWKRDDGKEMSVGVFVKSEPKLNILNLLK